jgi:hypothetical protein
MNARRLVTTLFVSICALVSLLALAVTSAQALVTHYYVPSVSETFNEGIPAEGPHGEAIAMPGPLNLTPLAMTVDSGIVWTVEGSQRIDEFDAATGAFAAQFATSPKAAFRVGNSGTAGIAVGHASGKSQVYVGEGIETGSAVAVYDEAGAVVGTWTGAGTPAGSFSRNRIDVAVDDSADALDKAKGDVYVSSAGLEGESSVVNVFAPQADGEEHYVGQITGPSTSETFGYVDAVAVNDGNGDVVVEALDKAIGSEAIYTFEPGALGEYVLVSTITATPKGHFHDAFNLAVDSSSGDIYVDDLVESEEVPGSAVDQFSAAGTYLGRITGPDTPIGYLHSAYAIAVDPESEDIYVGDPNQAEMDVFGPGIVFPDVSSSAASGVTRSTAVLNGSVNPDEAGAATCKFVWGTSKAFGKATPCEPETLANGTSAVPVHATLNELQSDTTYYFRLQASNANGTNPGEETEDQSFTTPGPRFEGQSVTNVASTSATFEATVNPNDEPATAYIEYGTSTGYGTEVPAAPGESLGSGEAPAQLAPVHVNGLAPGTVYHYRVVVISEQSPGRTEEFDGPDVTFTTQTGATSSLPDGRQWEMVTPPNKQGAVLQPISESAVSQASTNGSVLSYLANAPTEANPKGYAEQTQILSTRSATGWSSRDISSPLVSAPGYGAPQEFRFFSEDMSLAAIQPWGNFDPQLSDEASEQTAYLASLDCSSSCNRPLVTGKPGFANVPPGTVFSDGNNEEEYCQECGPKFQDATPDLSHIVVSSSAALTASAVGSEVGHLYEWVGGKLTLISELPNHGGPAREPSLGWRGQITRGAISRDGTRIFWEGKAPGVRAPGLYVYNALKGESTQVDLAEPTCVAEGKCESSGGEFQAASVDGSKVFFTDGYRLTKDSGSEFKAGEEEPTAEDLYECEVQVAPSGKLECKLTDLTPRTREEHGPFVSAEVTGDLLGASENGSYVYFAANGVLAPGATRTTCRYQRRPGTCNIYMYHDGVTTLVAVLSNKDAKAWTPATEAENPLSSAIVRLKSGVSPNGQFLAFMSHSSLTGYDNEDANTGEPDDEVYLYDGATKHLVCASCNPSGARPVGVNGEELTRAEVGGPVGLLEGEGEIAANIPGWTGIGDERALHQPRYLSDSGRLFFDSSDALVPSDVNGAEDVYEFEFPGVGGCSTSSSTFSSRSGGCVSLISSGTSAEESAFLEASEGGGDVFFLTFAKLVSQDVDTSDDIYDAHECTSASPCTPVAVPQPPACATAEACRVAPTPQPALFGAPTSATFAGAGNVVPEVGVKAAVKPLTRAQKLARALRACKPKGRKKRVVCERRARAEYGPAKPRKSASRKGNR